MADTKITGLTAIASLATGDLIPVVDDPAGTPVTTKATMAQVATLMASELVSDTAYASSWNGVTDDAPSKNAVYDKFEGFAQTSYRSAVWYQLSPNFTTTWSQGRAIGSNIIRYAPFIVFRRVTISDLGCYVWASSGNVKLAIYANSESTGRPTGTPLAETASINTSTTGAKSADITGSDVTLDPGVYWSAVWADNATVAVHSLNTATQGWMSHMYGDGTLSELLGACALESSETYGTWPDAASETFTRKDDGRDVAILFAKAV